MSGWNEYERLVVAELKRHSDELMKMNDQLGGIEKNISSLNTTHRMHSSAFGFIAGGVGAFVLEAIRKALIH